IEKAGEDKTNNIAEVSSQSLEVGRIVPIYKLTEGVSQPRLRKAIFNALQKFTSQVEELVPKQIIEQKALRPLQEAIKQMHFPDSEEDLLLAKKTISFMEFWFMQLPLAIKREENKQKQFEKEKRKVLLQPNGLVNSLLKNLPFDLTGAQRRVFNEIIKDLSLVTPMNRLVQGDVGSGKTIVALLTMLVAVERGFQASMMAPTEILAEQHFAKFQPMLLELGVNSCFLSGSMKVAEKREALTSIANGQAQIIIGTHALIQEGVEFANLGMVVVDEQHRFGVKQRDFLRRKGKNEEEAEKLALIDCLHMTATPIPRTLTLALYGNLDLSEIDELPPGRKPIKTKIIEAKKRSSAYDFVKKELKEGRQAYIVYPLIEESESLSAKAVTEEAEKLKETFSDFKVAVIHGKMRPEEKDNVMNSFRKNETQILLGTTVIEVGVDVPNASIMIIENAERFGLAQLHQLRGRVGRGSSQSYCMLFSGSKSVVSAERLSVMEQTENGFIIAQKDLELRGPGELMGTRQSGLSDFALASLMEFGYLLEEARNSANEFIHNNLELKGLPSEGRKKLNKTLEAASSIEGG
ncbi:MAG TPA: ATP-dependent DNA helicase RecG, partial [Vampirovibrionales bacterium]